jgi:hypothetical protein
MDHPHNSKEIGLQSVKKPFLEILSIVFDETF